MEKNNRRHFLRRAILVGGAISLHACHQKPVDRETMIPASKNKPKSPPLFLSMEKEQIMSLLDLTVEKYMDISGNCAQSAFIALKEVFELEGDDIIKALTPLPGLGEMGLLHRWLRTVAARSAATTQSPAALIGFRWSFWLACGLLRYARTGKLKGLHQRCEW